MRKNIPKKKKKELNIEKLKYFFMTKQKMQ